MDKITPNEMWFITRKWIVESLYKNFSQMNHKEGTKRERIDKLMGLIAKDIGKKPEDVKQFLLVDKIMDEFSLEGDRIREEIRMKAHEEREMGALEKSKPDSERNKIQAEISKRKKQNKKK